MARTEITIDYSRRGDGKGVDPRECGECMRTCDPAFFVLRQTLGAVELDPLYPRKLKSAS